MLIFLSLFLGGSFDDRDPGELNGPVRLKYINFQKKMGIQLQRDLRGLFAAVKFREMGKNPAQGVGLNRHPASV